MGTAAPKTKASPRMEEILARAAELFYANGYHATDLPPLGGRGKHLLRCTIPGHSIYRATVAHALASPWLGCPDCRAMIRSKAHTNSARSPHKREPPWV